MNERLPWFSRKFHFDLPAENFADVLERLRGTPGRLEERTAGLSPEVATRHEDGCWSLQENIGHFLDLEPLWAGRLDDILQKAETLRPADLENQRTHQANHDQADLEDLLTRFRKARLAFVARLESLGVEDFARTSLHPRLRQPMRLLDLCLFVAAHDDHHLARVTAVRER